MSDPRCGYCNAPTMTGCICRAHWSELLGLLDRCAGLEADLASAIARRGRYGETVAASSLHTGLPINTDAMDARRALMDALYGALRALGATERPATVDGAAEALRGREKALRGSWAAPVLLGDLEAALRPAVAATDKPKAQPGVRGRCPRCGARTFLRLVMGSFRCGQCREVVTMGEVRG